MQLLHQLLRLPGGNEGERIDGVGQQQHLRLLQRAAAQIVAHAVFLIDGEIVAQPDEQRRRSIDGSAVGPDAVDDLHFGDDFPHGQDVLGVGMLLQNFQQAEGIGFFTQHGVLLLL